MKEWIASGGRPLFFAGVQRADPLWEQKRAVLTALGAEEDAADGTWVDLKPTPAAGAATALAEWRADPTELWNALQQPVDPAVEAAVAAQVLEACRGALAELPAAIDLAPRAASAESPASDSPEAERSRLAARVMLGERSALEACISVWEKAQGAAAAA